jgi:hypothetical protein
MKSIIVLLLLLFQLFSIHHPYHFINVHALHKNDNDGHVGVDNPTQYLILPIDGTTLNNDEITTSNNNNANNKKGNHKPKLNIKSLGFSGSGFYFSYFLGVYKSLQKAGLVNKKTPVYGSSGGAIVAGGLCSGSSIEDMMDENLKVATFCNSSTTLCAGQLDELLVAELKQRAPKGNGWKNCNNRGHIHISHSYSKPNDFPVCNLTGGNWTINQFKSRQDLIDAVASSSFVIGASGFACNREFRGQPVMDGGYSISLPCDGMDDNSQIEKGCLAISVIPQPLWAYYAGRNYAIRIYPGMRGLQTLPLALNKWLSGTINAQIYLPIAHQLFDLGVEDGKYWIEQQKQK